MAEWLVGHARTVLIKKHHEVVLYFSHQVTHALLSLICDLFNHVVLALLTRDRLYASFI